MKTILMVLMLVFTAMTSSALAAYGESNLAKLQKKFSKAVADPVPWAGFWWPFIEGGMNNGTYDSRAESPLYKLDQALGNPSGATSWEYGSHGPGRGPDAWWGHCNGWATAAIMEREPRGSRRVNGVDFEVADRKGILSEYWMDAGADYIGTRVWDPGDVSSYAFWDVVPAQFHLLLTNIVGRQKRSVIIDRYTGAEVWNQPLVAYEMAPITPEDYLGPDPQYAGIYRVNVKATIWWANDEVDPEVITGNFQWKENLYFAKRTLRYELWLDAPPEFDRDGKLVRSGDIILTDNGYGGEWKNGTSYETLVDSHPDFIWIPLSYAPSSGEKNPYLNDSWVNTHLTGK